jgi:hypothetical protein
MDQIHIQFIKQFFNDRTSYEEYSKGNETLCYYEVNCVTKFLNLKEMRDLMLDLKITPKKIGHKMYIYSLDFGRLIKGACDFNHKNIGRHILLENIKTHPITLNGTEIDYPKGDNDYNTDMRCKYLIHLYLKAKYNFETHRVENCTDVIPMRVLRFLTPKQRSNLFIKEIGMMVQFTESDYTEDTIRYRDCKTVIKAFALDLIIFNEGDNPNQFCKKLDQRLQKRRRLLSNETDEEYYIQELVEAGFNKSIVKKLWKNFKVPKDIPCIKFNYVQEWLEYDTEEELLESMKKRLGGKLPGVDLLEKKMSRSSFRKFAMRCDRDIGVEIAEVFGNLQDAYMEISDKNRKLVTDDRKDLSNKIIRMMDLVVEDYRIVNLTALKKKDNVVKGKDKKIGKMNKIIRSLQKRIKKQNGNKPNVDLCHKDDIKEEMPIIKGIPEIIYSTGHSMSRKYLFNLYNSKCESGDVIRRSEKTLDSYIMKITGTPDQTLFENIYLNLKVIDEEPDICIVSDDDSEDLSDLEDMIFLENEDPLEL